MLRRQSRKLSGLNKEEGFTLLEVLFTLTLISLCVFLFSMAISQTKTVRANVKDDRQIEWHLFLSQMENDIRGTEFSNLNERRLTVLKFNVEKNTSERISYERFGSMIRRRVGGDGHQPMLTQVSTSEFILLTKNNVKLTVTFDNGEKFTAYVKVNGDEP